MEDKMVRILFTPIIREALTNGETVKLNKNQEELIQNILLEEVQFQNQKLKRIDSRFDEELFNSLCHYLKPFFYDIIYALENGQKNAREKIGKGIRNEISKNDLTQYVDITTAADVLNLTKKGVMYYVDTKRELAIPENFKMKNKFELNTFLKFVLSKQGSKIKDVLTLLEKKGFNCSEFRIKYYSDENPDTKNYY